MFVCNLTNCDNNNDSNSTKRINYKLSSSEHTIIHSSPSSPSLVIIYDKRTRSPKYVIEHLTLYDLLCDDNEEAAVLKKKRKPFFSEPTILNELFKVRHYIYRLNFKYNKNIDVYIMNPQ